MAGSERCGGGETGRGSGEKMVGHERRGGSVERMVGHKVVFGRRTNGHGWDSSMLYCLPATAKTGLGSASCNAIARVDTKKAIAL